MNAAGAIAPRSIVIDYQRDFERLQTTLFGTLFLPPDNVAHQCTVLDISPGGARVTCSRSQSLETCVVLYVEGFGRFNAFVIRSEEGELGLFFVCRDEKRLHILDKLAQYVEAGTISPTRLRRDERTQANAFGHFTRRDGYLIPCVILDISLHGMSLRSLTRPPVGEIVNLGGTFGRVTRHHDQGVAIQFVKVVAGDGLTVPGPVTSMVPLP